MIQLQQGVLIGRAPGVVEGGGRGFLAKGQAVEHVAYHGGWVLPSPPAVWAGPRTVNW